MAETVDQSAHEAVVGAGLAARPIEDQLPPPLRTGGVTTILLEGESVGEVSTEEVGEGIFTVTGYSFCVPAEVDLTRSMLPRPSATNGVWSTPRRIWGIPADAEVRLTITGERAVGWAVCNEYGGLVAAGPEGAWRISQMSFTEEGCDEAEAESAYFYRFGAMTSWSLDGSDLVLEGPGGALRYASG